jgi:hypothetical protein
MEVPSVKVEGKYFDLLEGNIIFNKPQHNYLMSMEDLEHLGQIMVAGSDGRANVQLETRKRLIDQLMLYYQLHCM